MLKNERGVTIIFITMLILVTMTILGIASIKLSIFNLNMAVNGEIMKKNLYAAESGTALAPLWLKSNLTEADYKDVSFLGTFEKSDYVINPNFMKENDFSVKIKHVTEIDPADGIEKVVLGKRKEAIVLVKAFPAQ